MSTVGLFNIPVTMGGKIELISPYSIKWTRGRFWEDKLTTKGTVSAGTTGNLPGGDWGGYDYDFKNCRTQVKWNEGTVYNVTKAGQQTDYHVQGEGEQKKLVAKTTATFEEQADSWITKKSSVIQSEVKKVLEAEIEYDTMTTTVEKACTVTAGAGESSVVMDATQINIKAPLYNVTAKGSVSIVGKGTASMNADTIKIG
jgi:hypothetical protein